MSIRAVTRAAGRLVAMSCAACALTSLGQAGSAAAQVAVVTQTVEDREVAGQLGHLIDVPVRDHEATEPQSLSALMRAGAEFPEPFLVLIDRPNDSVHVLRTADATLVSRVLGANVMLDSQYAVALATAELLEWLGVLPAARGRPSEPSRATAESKAAAQRVEQRGENARPALGWAAGADLELATSPGFDVSLARPAIAAELQLGRGTRPVWLALGARLAAPASWDRTLEPQRFTTGARRVEYSDVQTGLSGVVGFGAGRSTWFAQIEGGVTFAQVEAFADADRSLGAHDTASGYLSAGIGLRHRLASALALAATVAGQWRPERARYRVEGSKVLEEGPIRVATRIGLIWESALFP